MHLTDDMTTASRSQHWSCIKTSEHPSPCSSVKKQPLVLAQSKQQTLYAAPQKDFQLFTSTQASTWAAEKPFTPPPFASHAPQLQPQARSPARCPGAAATSCKNNLKSSSGSRTTLQSKRRRPCYRPQAPPHHQQQPTSCIAQIHPGCLISTFQTSDIYLRLESLSKDTEGFFHCQFREFSQNTGYTDSCNADFAAFYFFGSF